MSRLLLVAALAGCSGMDILDPAAVQSIPAGDARGSALSGSYRIRRVTRSCSGACGGTTNSGYPVSSCDVGNIDRLDATVTQTDGVLRAEVSDRPALYQGGLDSDGSYQMGAYATQGATLQITVRASGTLSHGSLWGTALSHTWGGLAGVAFDCQGVFDLSSDGE